MCLFNGFHLKTQINQPRTNPQNCKNGLDPAFPTLNLLFDLHLAFWFLFRAPEKVSACRLEKAGAPTPTRAVLFPPQAGILLDLTRKLMNLAHLVTLGLRGGHIVFRTKPVFDPVKKNETHLSHLFFVGGAGWASLNKLRLLPLHKGPG